MLTYRLVNNLKHAEDSEWQDLVSQTLGSDVHPSRQKGFCLAREALRECLKVLKSPLNIAKIRLENHRSLPDLPQFTLSISHTADWGAAVVGKKLQFVSVGIDIEPEARVVKEAILFRISHPDDAKLAPILIWSLKEAAFKALMNTGRFDRSEEFSSILISEKGWSHPSSNTQGEWQTETEAGMLIALAWIRI